MSSTFDAPGAYDDDAEARRRAELAADPDLGATPVDDDAGESDLEAIERELADEAKVTTLIPIEERPGWAVRCRLDFDAKALDGLRRQSKDRKFLDGIDGLKFSALLLASYTEAIVRHGKDLELPDVEAPITFLTRGLQEKLDVDSARGAVLKLFRLPGKVDSAARTLMTEAGYGDAIDTIEDPTT